MGADELQTARTLSQMRRAAIQRVLVMAASRLLDDTIPGHRFELADEAISDNTKLAADLIKAAQVLGLGEII